MCSNCAPSLQCLMVMVFVTSFPVPVSLQFSINVIQVQHLCWSAVLQVLHVCGCVAPLSVSVLSFFALSHTIGCRCVQACSVMADLSISHFSKASWCRFTASPWSPVFVPSPRCRSCHRCRGCDTYTTHDLFKSGRYGLSLLKGGSTLSRSEDHSDAKHPANPSDVFT